MTARETVQLHLYAGDDLLATTSLTLEKLPERPIWVLREPREVALTIRATHPLVVTHLLVTNPAALQALGLPETTRLPGRIGGQHHLPFRLKTDETLTICLAEGDAIVTLSPER